MQPTVSFIVPVYNVEQFLPECVKSIREQTDPSWELILVDDGSFDHCPELCDKYAGMDSRIFSIHQSNQGVSSARNVGIDHATGQWICFVDSDDYIRKDLIELLRPNMTDECDVVFFGYTRRTNTHSVTIVANTSFSFDLQDEDFQIGRFCSGMQNRFPEELFQVTLGIVSKVIRREVLTKNEIRFRRDLTNGEDQVFNLEVVKAGRKGCYVAQPLYVYRYVEGSASNAGGMATMRALQKSIAVIENKMMQKSTAREKQAFQQYLIVQIGYFCMWYYCNPELSKSRKVRKKEFVSLVSSNPYCTALELARVDYFRGMQKKILCFLIQNKCFLLLDCLIKYKIRARQKG